MRHPPRSVLLAVAGCAGSQKATQDWNAGSSHSGTTATAHHKGWNGELGIGARVSAGFIASGSGSDVVPTAFKLKGAIRNVDADGTTRRLLGINRSGGAVCVRGHGIRDGPVDDAAIGAITDGNAPVIRPARAGPGTPGTATPVPP